MFQKCTGLKNITIPDSVIQIGNSAFYQCVNIESEISLKNITSIEEYAFYGCSKMKGNWEVSPNLNTINRYTFYNCKERNGTLNVENMNTISEYAFYWCTGIGGSLNIENKESISAYAFYNCTGINELRNTEKLKIVKESAFNGCTGLKGKLILSNVTTIGANSFYNCTGITEVEINDSMTNEIGSNAFYNCISIEKLKIPISIGASGFSSVSNLKEIYFSKGTGKGYNYIESGSGVGYDITPWYYSRENEITVTIEDGVTSIGNFMFQNCTGLKNITIPDSVVQIGNSVFYQCVNIETEVSLKNITSIAEYAFYGCSKMKGNWDISPDLNTINRYTFYNCKERKGTLNLEKLNLLGEKSFYKCTGITGIENTTNLKKINPYVFYGCYGIIGKVSIEGNTIIDSNSFEGCTGINELEIGDNVTNEIGSGAFYNCTGLKSLKMPISLKIIQNGGNSIFSGITGLTQVNFTKGTGSGFNYQDTTSSYYPRYSATPWYYSKENELTITFEDGIDSIGTYMFKDCTGITYINIPKTVTKIRTSAFSGCTKIRQINYTGSSSDWASIAFEDGNDPIKSLTTPGVLNKNNGIADTGITLSGNYKIETKIKNTSFASSYNYIYSTGQNNFETYIDATNKQLHFTSNGTTKNSTSAMAQNQAYVLTEEVKNGTMSATVDGSEWLTESVTDGTSGNVKLFASSADNYTTNMVIYYFKVYKEDNLVLDLVPAIRGNTYEGKIAEKNGFYDKVQKKFIYSNNKEFELEGGVINCNEE